MTGYPCFFVHRSVQKTKLQSTKRNSFVTSQASLTGKPLEVRVVCYPIEPTSPPPTNGTASVSISLSIFLHERSEVYILFFRADTYMIARQFWQMRGLVFQGSRRPASLSENFVPDGDGAAKGQTSRQIWAPFPSGMYSFSCTDTLKLIQRSDPGAIFYGHGRDSDIDDIDKLLARKVECPSNTLLQHAPVARFGRQIIVFLIVIDEAMGTFANVDVFLYADTIVTSLSEYFDDHATALGGSPPPRGREVRVTVSRTDEHHHASTPPTAQYICDLLHGRPIEGGASESKGTIIKKVHYSKYMPSKNYEVCRRHLPNGALDNKNGGYIHKREGIQEVL
ncbi:hypothetical protein BKA82DRAFT_4014679 [Pisolithus tinctorius]|nr:hypothetical protein BKA82DRAFT_4014679 [Pisolithus tinctorius]